MKNALFNLKKTFFVTISQNIELQNLHINTYSSVPENVKMPYIAITFIKSASENTISKNNNTAQVEVSVFDDSKSLTKLSKILDIIEDISRKDVFNTSQNIVTILSLSIADTNFYNDVTKNLRTIKILYNTTFKLNDH